MAAISNIYISICKFFNSSIKKCQYFFNTEIVKIKKIVKQLKIFYYFFNSGDVWYVPEGLYEDT